MAEQQSMSQVDVEEEYSEPTPIRDALAEVHVLQWLFILLAAGYAVYSVGASGGTAGMLGGAVGASLVAWLLVYIYNM